MLLFALIQFSLEDANILRLERKHTNSHVASLESDFFSGSAYGRLASTAIFESLLFIVSSEGRLLPSDCVCLDIFDIQSVSVLVAADYKYLQVKYLSSFKSDCLIIYFEDEFQIGFRIDLLASLFAARTVNFHTCRHIADQRMQRIESRPGRKLGD